MKSFSFFSSLTLFFIIFHTQASARDYYVSTKGKTYFWRVDTVLTDGTKVPGNTWSFST